MFSRSRLAKVGLLVFVAGLILLFPARVAYRWFAPAEFVASGISGSVWNCHALVATAFGTYFLYMRMVLHFLLPFTSHFV